MERHSALSERPVRHAPRRLADWINPARTRKVPSLVDRVYKAKNLQLAWERVKANRGAGGVDGVTLADFEARLEEPLKRLQEELRTDTYRPQPVRRELMPTPGKPGELRPLGRPTLDAWVCQQALLTRLEPIFAAAFDAATFGSRKGSSATDALRKVWREIERGSWMRT